MPIITRVTQKPYKILNPLITNPLHSIDLMYLMKTIGIKRKKFSPVVSCHEYRQLEESELCSESDNRAVYTGIKKKLEFFSHSGFSFQLSLNTAKKMNRKTHLRSVVFLNSAGFSLVFCQCKCSLPSHRYYSGFWSHRT